MTQPVHVIEDPAGAQTALDPIRSRMLGELTQPDSASGLAKRMGLPRQKLNYHLRQLEKQGLVELVEVRQKRGFEERVVRSVAQSYVISPSTLGPLAADPERIRDEQSSAYMVAVAARTVREVATQRQAARMAGKQLPTLSVQSEVRFASHAKQTAFAAELTELVGELVARYHDDSAPDGRSFRVMAGAYPKPKHDD